MSQADEKKSLDQERAAHAYNLVKPVADSTDDKKKKMFKTQVKKLPSRIMASGLGPAVAFLEAKKYAPDLRAGLNDWIGKRPWAAPYVRDGRGDRLMLWIINGSSDFLRLATAECLAYLQWVGRFTDDLLGDVKDSED